MNKVTYQSHYLNSMTHSNRITLRIFLPTRQLSKLVDWWENLNSKRVWGLQMCRQCQKTSVWVSKRAMVTRSEGHRERVIMAERTRIAAREDRCPWESLLARIAVCEDRCLRGSLRGQLSLRQMSVCERTQSMCVSPRVVTLGSMLEKP